MLLNPFRFAGSGGGSSGIEYVGGKVASVAGSVGTTTNVVLTDLAGGLDTAPAAGDLVVVAYGVGGTGNAAAIGVTTAGYTEEAEIFADNFDDTDFSVSHKIMGGTPDTSVDISPTGNASNSGAVVIHVFRGVDAVTPMDVARTTATTAGSSQPNPPAITPVTAGAWIVACGAKASDAAMAAFTSSDLSNFIQQNVAGVNASLRIAGGTAEWAGGAFDPAQFGGGNSRTDSSTAAVTLALRPA